jgi:hypothetical protein
MMLQYVNVQIYNFWPDLLRNQIDVHLIIMSTSNYDVMEKGVNYVCLFPSPYCTMFDLILHDLPDQQAQYPVHPDCALW